MRLDCVTHADETAAGLKARATSNMTRLHIWLKGILAAAISGAAGGVLTGFAAVGIVRNTSIFKRELARL